MTVGQKIKEARLAHGLTQEKLAAQVGVQKSAIAKWETGRVENIKRSSLKTLAEALSLSPSELIGYDSADNNPHDPIMDEVASLLSKATPEQLASIVRYIKFTLQDS